MKIRSNSELEPSQMIAVCSWSIATIMGITPCVDCGVTSAPCLTSSCTAAKCPPLHARWSGVMSRISAPNSFYNGPESAFQSVPCYTKGKNPKIVFHRTKSDKLCLIAQRKTY